MTFEQLSAKEREVVGECLRAAANGPFFDHDSEFDTLFGIEREGVAAVAAAWPDVDDNDEAVELAVNNSMLHLCGYPHRRERYWAEWVSVPEEEVERILTKWRRLKGWE